MSYLSRHLLSVPCSWCGPCCCLHMSDQQTKEHACRAVMGGAVYC